jgi:hypothetical protein
LENQSAPAGRIDHDERTILDDRVAVLLYFPFRAPLSFLSGRRKTRRCPVCGWETVGSGLFCPYNATPLEDSGSSEKRKDD